uniref:Ribosome biogenesis protein SLX9 n=1 Tax=Syphacia muris TaxID=451379 RepID=A0A0N5AYY1_9BILA
MSSNKPSSNSTVSSRRKQAKPQRFSTDLANFQSNDSEAEAATLESEAKHLKLITHEHVSSAGRIQNLISSAYPVAAAVTITVTSVSAESIY